MTSKLREKLLDTELPDDPEILIIGDSITIPQAKEIIRRTDDRIIYPFALKEHRDYLDRLLPAIGYPLDSENEDLWDLRERWCERWQVIRLMFMQNNWLAPFQGEVGHGWCRPDGTILYRGKMENYPIPDEILEEWELLAAAFPFLNLHAVIGAWNEALVGYEVRNGCADLFDPAEYQPVAEMVLQAESMCRPPSRRKSGLYLPKEWLDEWVALAAERKLHGNRR